MAPMAGIESTALGLAMRQSTWLYPAVETAHIIGLAILVGSIAVLDLRLLGFSRSLSVKKLSAHVLPWSLAGFALIVPSGLMMFVAHAGDLVSNPVFAVKVCLILGAGANAAILHTGALRGAAGWDVDAMPPLAARMAAAASLLLWFSVIACGRLLAYT